MAIELLTDEEIESWTQVSEESQQGWTRGEARRMLATIRHLKEQDSLGQILAMQRTFRTRINEKLEMENPEDVWSHASYMEYPDERVLPPAHLKVVEERVGHYVTCLQQEAAEIRDWTRWKEWSEQLGNKHPTIKAGSKEWLHEIRIEVVDMICFLFNLAAWLGMFTPQIILKYYMLKVKENHARQDSGKY